MLSERTTLATCRPKEHLGLMWWTGIQQLRAHIPAQMCLRSWVVRTSGAATQKARAKLPRRKARSDRRSPLSHRPKPPQAPEGTLVSSRLSIRKVPNPCWPSAADAVGHGRLDLSFCFGCRVCADLEVISSAHIMSSFEHFRPMPYD